MNVKVCVGCLIGVVAILYQLDALFITFTILAHLLVAAVGIYLGMSMELIQGKQYKPKPIPSKLQHPQATILLQNMMEAQSSQESGPKKVVTTRNMDLALQDIIDLLMRDFIISWYKDISLDQEPLVSSLQSDLWVVIGEMMRVLSNIDTVNFMTKDVVDILMNHFKKVRLASKRGNNEGPVTNFRLHPWLKSEEAELTFLRKVSEALLLVVFPKCYSRSAKLRHLFREVLSTTVLKPSIDMLCDPDYINLKLLGYIEYREKLSEDTRRTYTYAATYEDFVKMIEKCTDIEHLKQLRFNTMTEIMQATTINNLKKSNDKQGYPKGSKSTAKGELLKQRNLKRYINQLTVAKARCEKQIQSLGGIDYKYCTEDSDEVRRGSIMPGQKMQSFKSIMDSHTGREYFKSFLERDENESLIGFWNAVHKLRNVEKRQQHHVGTDTYQRYISSSTSKARNFIEKSVIKGMETFMKGDAGPEAFFEAQKAVSKVLEDDHYPSFLVSDLYLRYLASLEENGGDTGMPSTKDELFFKPKEGSSDEEEEDEMFSAQSYSAKQKLQQLASKITNKTQALEAFRISSKSDPNYHKAIEDLEHELEGLKVERRNLESHILRTTTWCENVGKWRAHIYESTLPTDGDKTPLFVIVIHLSGSTSQNLQNSTQGWVVTRKLQDFYNVHEKLVQMLQQEGNVAGRKISGGWLKGKELPKISRFTTVDNKFLKEAKEVLNDYLATIMKDERLAQSEALYGFLTPTPDYFQQPVQGKKSGFFLRNILKSLPLVQDNREPDEELQFSVDDRAEDRSKDSIAEPLYGLINEVYELHGMFRWLRKSFIAFVEVTFGRSINRQLRETVHWIFSESMIIYYIKMFKESMWPNGQLADPAPARSEEEKKRTRVKAKEKFLLIQPDAVKTLVGEENARRGTIKMFEVLQDVRLNKQLFYDILLLLLCHMIPELRDLLSEETHEETPLVLSTSEAQTLDKS